MIFMVAVRLDSFSRRFSSFQVIDRLAGLEAPRRRGPGARTGQEATAEMQDVRVRLGSWGEWHPGERDGDRDILLVLVQLLGGPGG